MDLMDAARLVENSYKGSAHLPPIRLDISECHVVQAFLLTDNTLVIPGSNELVDYTKSNLVTGRQKISWNSMGKAAGNAIWHRGFAGHASTMANKLGSLRPTFIVGHSLGAAAAQILGCVHGVPAIGFVSPMPRRGKTRLTHEGLVLNVVPTTIQSAGCRRNISGFAAWATPKSCTPRHQTRARIIPCRITSS